MQGEATPVGSEGRTRATHRYLDKALEKGHHH